MSLGKHMKKGKCTGNLATCGCPSCTGIQRAAQQRQMLAKTGLTQPDPAESEIEVGRYALRTFNLWRGGLYSLFQETQWSGGTAIAECLISPGGKLAMTWGSTPAVRYEYPEMKCKSAPGENCACGLYGTLGVDQLVYEYSAYAGGSMAVFAAEGTSYIGSRGLRTAAARVVAYWAANDRIADVYVKNCDAPRAPTLYGLLDDFGFEQPNESAKRHLSDIWDSFYPRVRTPSRVEDRWKELFGGKL